MEPRRLEGEYVFVTVDAEVPAGTHLALRVHECLSEDPHGNVTVSATRFRGVVRAQIGG